MSTIGVAAKVLSLSSVAEICWVVMRWRFGHQRNAFMIIAEAFRNRGYIRPLILRDKLVWQVGLFCVTCCLMFFFFFFQGDRLWKRTPFILKTQVSCRFPILLPHVSNGLSLTYLNLSWSVWYHVPFIVFSLKAACENLTFYFEGQDGWQVSDKFANLPTNLAANH